MTSIARSICAALAVFLMAGASGWASEATVRGACRADIEDALAGIGIDAADVSQITTYVQHTRIGNDDDARIAGYRTWVRLDRCETGYVVLEHSAFCQVRRMYTRGDCAVDGLAGFR